MLLLLRDIECLQGNCGCSVLVLVDTLRPKLKSLVLEISTFICTASPLKGKMSDIYSLALLMEVTLLITTDIYSPIPEQKNTS